MGVANLGTRQRLQCPDSHPMSYPASHLMAPPLQSSPEAASGSAQLSIYFPFRFKPGIVFPTQAKTPAGPATWNCTVRRRLPGLYKRALLQLLRLEAGQEIETLVIRKLGMQRILSH